VPPREREAGAGHGRSTQSALGPLNWTGLEVLHEQMRGDAGVVEFVAHHKVNGRAAKLHEVGRFVREGGAWRYVDGVVAPDSTGDPGL
jgi:uncharacterized protein YchJ